MFDKERVKERVSSSEKAPGYEEHPTRREVQREADDFTVEVENVEPIDPQDPVEGVRVTASLQALGVTWARIEYLADDAGNIEHVVSVSKR